MKRPLMDLHIHENTADRSKSAGSKLSSTLSSLSVRSAMMVDTNSVTAGHACVTGCGHFCVLSHG